MKKTMRQAIVIGSLVVLGLGWARLGQGQAQKAVPSTDDPKAWADLTPDQIAKVKAGELVILQEDQSSSDRQKRLIRCAMVFNQPIDRAWAVLTQTDKQHEYLPRLDKCVLVKREANWDQVDFFVKVLFININYRVKHEFEPDQYYFHWALDPTYKNDLNHLEGFWQLYQMPDGRTLGRYGTKVIMAPYFPESVQEFMTRRDLPEALGALKKRVDSGGAWHK
jgi:hypothetical protein